MNKVNECYINQLPPEILMGIFLHAAEENGLGELPIYADVCSVWNNVLATQLIIFKPLAQRTLNLGDSDRHLIDDQKIKEVAKEAYKVVKEASEFEKLLNGFLNKIPIEYDISKKKDANANAKFCKDLFLFVLE